MISALLIDLDDTLLANDMKRFLPVYLDRLGELGYVRRQKDPLDRRSVQVQRTVKGSVFLSDFAELVVSAGRK